MTPNAWTTTQPPLPPSREWAAAGDGEPDNVTELPDTWPDDMPGGALRRSTHLVTNMSMCRAARLFVHHSAGRLGTGQARRRRVHLCERTRQQRTAARQQRSDEPSPAPPPTGLGDAAACGRNALLAGTRRKPSRPGTDTVARRRRAATRSGYGLRIVQSRSDGWSWWPVEAGKVVECRFAVDSPGEPSVT